MEVTESCEAMVYLENESRFKDSAPGEWLMLDALQRIAADVVEPSLRTVFDKSQMLGPTFVFLAMKDMRTRERFDRPRLLYMLLSERISTKHRRELIEQVADSVGAVGLLIADECFVVVMDKEAAEQRERKGGGPLAEHPDRVEVVALLGENSEGGFLWQYPIIRKPNAPAVLGVRLASPTMRGVDALTNLSGIMFGVFHRPVGDA